MSDTYEIYDYKYYRHNCGAPYEDVEVWMRQFGIIADYIVEHFHPKTVLDAGCAMGYLVSALRDRGVEAYGVDISQYAISKVREDIMPYCFVGSLTEPLPKELPERFDLVTNIEILEHLYEEDSANAIDTLCSVTDTILFSSTSDDVKEATHVNVQLLEYWAKRFSVRGFYRQVWMKPIDVLPNAVLFRRTQDVARVVEDYEHNARLLHTEIHELKKKYGTAEQIVMVLIDSGNGYDEEERIYSCHTPDDPVVDIGITVPEGGKRLRIEPARGYSCLVSGVRVEPCEPGVTVRLKEHNGMMTGNSFLFETKEPAIIYELEGKTPAVLHIVATVMAFSSSLPCMEMRKILDASAKQAQMNAAAQLAESQELLRREKGYVEQERQERAALEQTLTAEKDAAALIRRKMERERQEKAVLEQALAAEKDAAASIRQQVERDISELRELLWQEKSSAAEEKQRMESELKQQQETLRKAEEDLQGAEADLAYCKKQEERLRRAQACGEKELRNAAQQLERLREVEDQLAAVELERNTLAARLNTTTIQVIETFEQIKQFKAAYDSIESSTCWRMTAPLRHVLDFLKGKRHPKSAKKEVEQQASEPVPQQPVEPIQQPAPQQPAPVAATDPADMLPESLFRNRMEAERLADELAAYDVVSFDIFDTLILRTLDSPTDVFRLLGHRIGEEGFPKLRVQAEQEARRRHAKENGEVNIYEIYEVLSEYLMINKEQAIACELQAEKDCCYANPYMKTVYDRLIAEGKEIIIISDMYWPEKYLRELLAACGYRGYSKLYVSCEYRQGKGNGKLQEIADRDHPTAKKIVHVGDNQVSDIAAPQKMGWDAIYYPSCHELGDSLRPSGMDRLSASAYRSIVNAHLHAGSEVYSPAYEHGFRYAGFLACGFCEWLNRYVEDNHIDRIFFLARDADILYKIYNKHYRKVENRYVVTSRLAMWEMAFSSDPEEFIQNFFLLRANLGTQTIQCALEETDLEMLVPLLPGSGLCAGSRLTRENYADLHDFLMDHYADISAHFAASKQAGQQYFREMAGDAKNICAVDIGWSGQILIMMRKEFREILGPNVNLRGAYMAVTNNETTSGYVESGIISAYLFHSCMNRDLAIKTASLEGDMQAKFMEATFTSDQNTLLKYVPGLNGTVQMLYGLIKNVDPELVHEMQAGVMRFADLWAEYRRRDPSVAQIMPTDVKCVLDQAITNYRYCYALFGDIREWEFALPNFKGQGSITTLGTMLAQRGMV